MHTDEPREIQGVELGYDPRDIDMPKIKKATLWFFLFTLFFFGLGAIIFVHMGWGARTSFDSRKAAFDGPKVQGNVVAKVDIMTMRQNERKMMETYGTNPDGKQRIPVDHAIDLIVSRGLPAMTSDAPAQSKGNTIEQNATGPAAGGVPTPPTESGSAPTPDSSGGSATPPAGAVPGAPTTP